MYALMRTIQLKPGKTTEFINCWQDSEMPKLKHQPGHKQTFLMKISDRDEVILFNVWASKADSERWGCSAPYWEAYAEIEGYWLKPPCLAEYTVIQPETAFIAD